MHFLALSTRMHTVYIFYWITETNDEQVFVTHYVNTGFQLFPLKQQSAFHLKHKKPPGAALGCKGIQAWWRRGFFSPQTIITKQTAVSLINRSSQTHNTTLSIITIWLVNTSKILFQEASNAPALDRHPVSSSRNTPTLQPAYWLFVFVLIFQPCTIHKEGALTRRFFR